MKLSLLAATLASLLVSLAANPPPNPSPPAKPASPPDQSAEALDLGLKILAIHHALDHPELPASLKAITDLGTDSRHYSMVRGWLSQLLSADESIASASKDNTPPRITTRIAFLKKAIRAIDLE
jgi:hypothetical protein